ncbi:unnamed protein product [Rotaria sp. Silwood2]|nr:unnamed protein product [Rotaria sp. Silwood2]CAF3053566.1 unnamed protein product [Rotaria sp. Silwood2]CAF3326324.1 unnamed protein product [Rotaria sp. Silwood2]CAF3375710.1 unnamed protein product [Rotaria sp. Silwood2]CAF4231919.1 unnamed protein product [Rotaria sp. Silwood2]
MESVEKELSLLEHDIEQMRNVTDNHQIFNQINKWEQESTTKVQIIAVLARADLSHLLETNTNRLQSDFNRISQQIQSCRDSNHSERDIDQWIIEIKKCRQDIPKALESIKLSSDLEFEPIQFVRITERHDQHYAGANNDTTVACSVDPIPSSFTCLSRAVGKILSGNAERFEKVVGDAELEENYLIAKKKNVHSTSIRGAQLYSTGTHQIRFRIEHLSNNSIFIGIIPSNEQMTTTSFKLSSSYGWWDTKFPVIGGIHVVNGTYSMHSGDEISLTLVCNETRLVYHNKRTGFGKISVNLSACPLPWQLLVVLGAGENIVRILP